MSRLPVETNPAGAFDTKEHLEINQIAALAAPVAIKLSEIETSSENDTTIQEVKMALQNGKWTETVSLYKPFETEFCSAGSILLRGDKMVIPEALRKRTLELAHEGHPGMTVMKRRIRSKVWWPKVDQDVESIVKACRGCMLTSAPSAPEPMKRTELPSKPWQHLAIDFMGPLPSGHNLIVVVDYYSRYIEVEIMKKIDSSEAIKRLRIIFARFGLPITIKTDNGPQFVSREFETFCEENNNKRISTIPYWQQQNGEVESQNRSLLKRLIISQNTGRNWSDDLQDYLLMYRATPHSTTLKSPTEMLLGYTIRDKIPNIEQPFERDEEAADRDKKKKEIEREYADNRRNAAKSDIAIGDEVLVKRAVKSNKLSSTFETEPLKVVERKGSEVILQATEGNRQVRRNVAHVKRIHKESERFDDFEMSIIRTRKNISKRRK